MDWGGKDSYSDLVEGFHNPFEDADELVMAALDKMSPRSGHPFVIGDYGTCDGGRSYKLIRKCIAFLRKKYGKELPIQIVYEDQPTNDYRPIFLKTNGLMPGEPGLLDEFDNVYVLVSGTSFYQQCVPPESMDLIFLVYASHWLSGSPGNLTDAIYAGRTIGSEREAYERQAAKDWETFHRHRAAELVPGGFLIDVAVMSGEIHPDQLSGKLSLEDLFAEMADIWKGMVKGGLITHDEFREMNIPFYFRSKDELLQVFQDATSPVTKSGLKLQSHSTKLAEWPLRAAKECEQDSKDETPSRNVVEKYIATHRVYTEAIFARGLASHRSVEEKRNILDEFYDRFVDQVMNEPEKHGPFISTALLVSRKVTSASAH